MCYVCWVGVVVGIWVGGLVGVEDDGYVVCLDLVVWLGVGDGYFFWVVVVDYVVV